MDSKRNPRDLRVTGINWFKTLHDFRNVVAKLYCTANGSIVDSSNHKLNHSIYCDFVQTGKIDIDLLVCILFVMI